MKPWDVVIVGGGILGTALSYWLSSRYDARIAVIEQEGDVARHASGRNTGVIHRPFHLHPQKSKLFAQSARLSYDLWEAYAETRGFPWKVVSTLELATREGDLARLEAYMQWAHKNGLQEEEVDLLDSRSVASIEPHVRCAGALHVKRETSVDFGAFTRGLSEDAQANGVKFLLRRRVLAVKPQRDNVELDVEGSRQPHRADFVINCAGGGAVDLAHGCGVALEYTDLHFRGDYWRVRTEAAPLGRRNLYTVPRHPEFPFLDPHWIVRPSGEREIGPTAVPVATPWTYEGFFEDLPTLLAKIFEEPIRSKGRLLLSPAFLQLALEESLGAVSKSLLISRVNRFLPTLRAEDLIERGTAGVRSSVIDQRGNFLKEVLELEGPSSMHVLNYNSPGATGAPAYTAHLLRRLESAGQFESLRRQGSLGRETWDFDDVTSALP